MAEKTISTLLAKPRNLQRIKDYARVENIFNLYGNGHYDTMSREIYDYGMLDFFLDFMNYLRMNFQVKEYHDFFYDHIYALYSDRENMVHNELNYKKYIRRQKRKYRL